VLWAVTVVNEIASQSAASGLVESGLQRGIEQARMEAPGSAQEDIDMVAGFLEDALIPPLALPIPDSVALLLGIAASVLTITVLVVGYRTFVKDGSESVPAENYQRNMLGATINGFIGSILYSIIVAVGLILLVVPGIFFAISFAFYLVYISLHDVGFIGGLKRSWGLTSGNRFSIFLFGVGIFFVFVGLWIVGGIASSVVGFAGAVPGELVSIAFSAYGSAIVVGGLAHSYLQLEGEQTPQT